MMALYKRKHVKRFAKVHPGQNLPRYMILLLKEVKRKTFIYGFQIKNCLTDFEEGFEKIFTVRKEEADEFYNAILPPNISQEHKNIQRQALAGMLWSKQFYHYDVERWLSTSDGITAS